MTCNDWWEFLLFWYHFLSSTHYLALTITYEEQRTLGSLRKLPVRGYHFWDPSVFLENQYDYWCFCKFNLVENSSEWCNANVVFRIVSGKEITDWKPRKKRAISNTIIEMLFFLLLNQTLLCDDSFESSRLDDWMNGHTIRFGWKKVKVIVKTSLITYVYLEHS